MMRIYREDRVCYLSDIKYGEFFVIKTSDMFSIGVKYRGKPFIKDVDDEGVDRLTNGKTYNMSKGQFEKIQFQVLKITDNNIDFLEKFDPIILAYDRGMIRSEEVTIHYKIIGDELSLTCYNKNIKTSIGFSLPIGKDHTEIIHSVFKFIKDIDDHKKDNESE